MTPTQARPTRDIPAPGPLAPIERCPRYDGELDRVYVLIRRAIEWLELKPKCADNSRKAEAALKEAERLRGI